MSNELLGKLIRWESMWFRVGYWVGLLIFGLISMAVHTGSVNTQFFKIATYSYPSFSP